LLQPLPPKEIKLRLEQLGYKCKLIPDDMIVLSKEPHYFPYATPRKIAYHIPNYPEDLQLPVPVIEDILLHLFLTSDEEMKFWRVDSPDDLHR
jgi:hypothetical protein